MQTVCFYSATHNKRVPLKRNVFSIAPETDFMTCFIVASFTTRRSSRSNSFLDRAGKIALSATNVLAKLSVAASRLFFPTSSIRPVEWFSVLERRILGCSGKNMTVSRRFASTRCRKFSPGRHSSADAVLCSHLRRRKATSFPLPRSRSRGHYFETIDNIRSRRNRIPEEEDFCWRTGGWAGARNLFSRRQTELLREFGKPRTVTAESIGGEVREIGSPPLPPLISHDKFHDTTKIISSCCRRRGTRNSFSLRIEGDSEIPKSPTLARNDDRKDDFRMTLRVRSGEERDGCTDVSYSGAGSN